MKSVFRLALVVSVVGAGLLGLQRATGSVGLEPEEQSLPTVADMADPRLILQPKVTGPVTIRMNQPSRQAFETLAELAGIQIVFHRQFQASAPFQFTVENVDIFTALDLLSFQTGNFWQVNDAHTIIVATDNPTVRREVEPMIMKTFYLVNVTRQQDITELVTMLRTVLSINSLSVSTPLSAITIRDTPDKVALVESLLGNSGVLARTPLPDRQANPSGNGGAALTAQIPRATAIATDDAGNIFIIDSNRLRWITDGLIRAAIVDGISEPYAAGIASDVSGNLYITDDINHRVRRLSPTGTVTTLAGTGRAGFSGDGGPSSSAQLNAPTKVAVDRTGNVFIADSGNGRIRRISSNGVISTIAGNGAWGYGGDGGPATSARLGSISGLGVDGAGNVFIGDGNSRVRKINTKGIITVIAGTGTPGATGDFGPAASAQIEVSSLAVDSAGNVFITEVNRIRRISTDGTIQTIAGNTAPGFSGDNGPAASARLRGPRAVAVGSTGALYVADTLNGRIRKVANETIRTVAGATPQQ